MESLVLILGLFVQKHTDKLRIIYDQFILKRCIFKRIVRWGEKTIKTWHIFNWKTYFILLFLSRSRGKQLQVLFCKMQGSALPRVFEAVKSLSQHQNSSLVSQNFSISSNIWTIVTAGQTTLTWFNYFQMIRFCNRFQFVQKILKFGCFRTLRFAKSLWKTSFLKFVRPAGKNKRHQGGNTMKPFTIYVLEKILQII